MFMFLAFLLAAGCMQIEKQPEITNFRECVEAGYPVEDFPYVRICTANGQNFTYDILLPDTMPPGWDEPADGLPEIYPGNCHEMKGTAVKASEGCAEGEEIIARLKGFKEPYVCCFAESTIEKNYCTPNSRQADLCIAVYEPVCGWFEGDKIRTTYSNSCNACKDSRVVYWTEGEC